MTTTRKVPAVILLLTYWVVLPVAPAFGQISFALADLPSSLGDWCRAYVGTNELDVAKMIGSTGGPQRWDFSTPPGADEDVHRIDVVPKGDGAHGTDFAQAAYAERTTRDSNGLQSWSYYAVLPGTGRAYFGFYDPVSNPVDPGAVFDAPTVDLPATIKYNQNWHREVDFQDVLDMGFIQINVVIHFTCDAVVDAYGTLVLPKIGAVPALRVNELHTYDTQDTTMGLPIGSQYIRNYYWLVPGIGQAVQVISKPDATAPPPNDFPLAATLFRVFESSKLSAPPPGPWPAKNVRIIQKGAEVFLTWDKDPTATNYQIENSGALDNQPVWRTLTQTTDTYAFEPLDRALGTEFYRVLCIP